MKRPVQAAPQPTDEERRQARRFTKRMALLALAGNLFGSCVRYALIEPRLAGAMPAPRLEAPSAGERKTR